MTLHFFENLGRLLPGGFETVFSAFGGTSWMRGWPIARSLRIQRTAQIGTSIDASSGIRTHDPNNQEVKIHYTGITSCPLEKELSKKKYGVKYLDAVSVFVVFVMFEILKRAQVQVNQLRTKIQP